jgi:hypothetical protein
MGWITDDNGTRRFNSPEAPDWELTVFAHDPNRIYVDSPGDSEVSVESEGIEVSAKVALVIISTESGSLSLG